MKTKKKHETIFIKNIGCLDNIAKYGGKSVYVHPEDLPQLPRRFQLRRPWETYMKGVPGLETALSHDSVYIDVGAGGAVAISEFAGAHPDARTIAISNKPYACPQGLPTNVDYIVGPAQDILPRLIGKRLKARVIIDYYGAFTFSPGEHVGLLQLYHAALDKGGRAFIRFDADHVGVITKSGLVLFDDWLKSLKMPDVIVTNGPNPTGPTGQVSVVNISKKREGLNLPELELVGIGTVKGDAVPFVVYKEIQK